MSVPSASGLVVGDFVGGSGPELAVSEAARDSVVVFAATCTGSLPTSITVVSPTGGEVWPQGSIQHITWSKGAGVAAVNVDVSRDNGTSWLRIASSQPGTTLPWKVTAPGTVLGRVRIADALSASHFGLSNAPLTIQRTGTGVPPAGRPSISRLSPPMPSPAYGAVRFEMDLPLPGEVHVDVYDVAGRHVRKLVDEVRPAGRYALQWDGKTGAGIWSGPGVYFIRARWPGYAVEHKLVRLR